MSPPPPLPPGALAPERSRDFISDGFRLRLHEWGDPGAVPIVLSHGMWDHGRGFDLLAPLLCERYRLVAIDSRGHGDSDHADTYIWPMDVGDIANVVRSLDRPVVLLGHSKGGGQATDAATLVPELVVKLVNIEGFGPPKGGFKGPGHADMPESTAERMAAFLDSRRKLGEQPGWRPYASLQELVKRRKAMNPRLSEPWLSHFVFHAARQTQDGWTWKSDSHARLGFGPFKPEWIAPSWKWLKAPMLALVGEEPDTWGPPDQETLDERLQHVRAPVQRVSVPEAGHFVHMEQPAAAAALVRDFLED